MKMWSLVRSELRYNIPLLIYQGVLILSVFLIVFLIVHKDPVQSEKEVLAISGVLLMFGGAATGLLVLSWQDSYLRERRDKMLSLLPTLSTERRKAIYFILALNYLPSAFAMVLLVGYIAAQSPIVPIALGYNLFTILFAFVGVVTLFRMSMNSTSSMTINKVGFIPVFGGLMAALLLLNLNNGLAILGSGTISLICFPVGLLVFHLTAQSMAVQKERS